MFEHDTKLGTITITTEEYARLVRNSAYLEVILAHKIDKAYPSDVEAEIQRIQGILLPLTIVTEAEGVRKAPEEGEDDA